MEVEEEPGLTPRELAEVAPKGAAGMAPREVAEKVELEKVELESMEVTGEVEEMAKWKLETVPKGETEQQEGKHHSRKDAKKEKEDKKNEGSGRGRNRKSSRSDMNPRVLPQVLHESSHSTTKNISTINKWKPGEKRDHQVVKKGAGMEKSQKKLREKSRSKLSIPPLKQPLDCLSSPTDPPRSNSKAKRMAESTED